MFLNECFSSRLRTGQVDNVNVRELGKIFSLIVCENIFDMFSAAGEAKRSLGSP